LAAGVRHFFEGTDRNVCATQDWQGRPTDRA